MFMIAGGILLAGMIPTLLICVVGIFWFMFLCVYEAFGGK